MRPEASNRLTLYSYWRSSAAYRVRIALHLKGLDFKTLPVHLTRHGGEQNAGAYRAVNPQGLVPVLLHGKQVLTQSMAICEYLDEAFDAHPLLPADAPGRARVRSLALQIACEIHPLNNLRVQKYLKRQCGDAADTVAWMRHWMQAGFTAIEQRLDETRVGYSGNDAGHPGLFECFLVPQVYNAERYGMDMSAFPAIREIVSRCRELAAFTRAAPENQPDAEPL
ncbi:MAG: maleylacetoacetate isomerase [Lysobacterales bacterium]